MKRGVRFGRQVTNAHFKTMQQQAAATARATVQCALVYATFSDSAGLARQGGNDNTGTQLILTAKIYSLRNNAILVRECGALAQSKRLRVCVRVR